MNDNPPTNQNSLLVKSLVAFILLLVVGAVVYMYFYIFMLKHDSGATSGPILQENASDTALTEMTAPPRSDIQITPARSAEIQSDLRTPAPKNVSTTSAKQNEEVRSQLTN